METKITKEWLLEKAKDYINAYNEEWEGYEDALDFATDGKTLADMIVEFFKEN